MTEAEKKRERRVRFDACEVKVFPDSRCRCRVTLEWIGGPRFSEDAEETDTQQGRLRLGALACMRAAEASTGGQLVLELRGIKAVRAFDSTVVIVSIRGRHEDERFDLLGSATAPDDDSPDAHNSVRGAALAVLDATNRLLGRFAPAEED